MKRLAWAVSGEGRALEAVLQASDAGLLPVRVVAVAIDRPSRISAVAEARGLPCPLIAPGPLPYHPDLARLLAATGAEWLGLTFNRLLSTEVIDHMEGRIFNLHLSLLPMFPGFGALRRALAEGMRMTAVTVHLVNTTLDQGPILAQGCVPVARRDTRATLGRRLFEAALPLLLQVVRSIGQGELRFTPATGLEWERTDRAPAAPTPRFPLVDEDLLAFAEAYCAALPVA
ncbi:MAG: formyltransferase family protein [Roseococcus sp.]|nr:formyltransferase family protein [Roseococcus sp.]